jgi:hypothetical protein
MHVIESIGPILGIVAFVGLATLAFLLFQQGRDIRRLREWAGRAPERAREAAEATQAVGEASRGEPAAADEPEGSPGRLRAWWTKARNAVGSRLSRLDRRLPVDGRYVLAAALVAVVVAGVVTSGFGLFGGDENKRDRHGASSGKPSVAVLNGTGVPGLADQVDKQVVEKAGYRTRTVANADASFDNTVVMFASGHEADAKRLAKEIAPKLGDTPTEKMTADVEARSKGAPLALGLGLDDAQFTSSGG